MENMQKNIFITGCAGSGKVRMISEERTEQDDL